jgi:pimeloyl-ACP methyl ester carboxylesterase
LGSLALMKRELDISYCASLALDSYIEDESGLWHTVSYDENTDTLGIINWDKDRGIITCTFRGTQSWKNWTSTNLLVLGKLDGHDGVFLASLYHRRVIFRLIEALPVNEIVFIGHSLGGAISLRTAEAVKNKYRGMEIFVVTFGALSVHSKKGKKRYEGTFPNNTLTFQNNSDVVPRLLSPCFKSVGVKYYFDSKGNMHKGPSRRYKAFDILRGVFEGVKRLHFDQTADHNMEEYYRLSVKNNATIEELLRR